MGSDLRRLPQMGRQQLRSGTSGAEIERRTWNQRRRGMKAEMALRTLLWRRDLRNRLDLKVVGRRRRVEIAFTLAKVVVFGDPGPTGSPFRHLTVCRAPQVPSPQWIWLPTGRT